MTPSQHSQRGEGKLGCILTLLILVGLAAITLKAFPVFYSNMELADACDFIATSASRLPREQVEANVRQKAKELEIAEALRPGAIHVVKVSGEPGTCTITLKYTRSIDFYGFYTYKYETSKTISRQIYTNI